MAAVNGSVNGTNSVAVTGTATGKDSLGVLGKGELWGVRAQGAIGLRGEGQTWHGVEGISQSTTGGFGVFGTNTAGGTGVVGISSGWIGVYGESQSTRGGSGVWGEHKNGGNGVVGIGHGNGAGIYGKGGRVAGYFEGDVEVTGDIRLLNADCAEDFDVGTSVPVEPGTVMVLNDDGALVPSDGAYDSRVAGIVSGAGTYKPGLVLDKRPSQRLRQPIALMGKAFCKIDASHGAIAAGDLLTTSPTPGHAMKVGDPARAFGAVIGKALCGLRDGCELVPVLIALH
jgi:hypothetical protein